MPARPAQVGPLERVPETFILWLPKMPAMRGKKGLGTKPMVHTEIVTIEMGPSDRMRLAEQIDAMMHKLGYGDYAALRLGFDLPANWPADFRSEISLYQLGILARRLQMRVVISNLDLVRT